MVALSIAKLKMFSPESEIFLWIKPKKKKTLDQYWCLEVCEKARNVFCDEPVSLSDHKVLHSNKFFSISLGFSRFFRSYFVLKIFGVQGIE